MIKKLIFLMMTLGLVFFTACTGEREPATTEEVVEEVQEAADDAADATEEAAEEAEEAVEDAM